MILDKQQKEPKEVKPNKDEPSKKALINRVRKVVKKSQRKLGDAQFEKELQRTISFLTELCKRPDKAHVKAARKSEGRAKVESKARKEPNPGDGKAKPTKPKAVSPALAVSTAA